MNARGTGGVGGRMPACDRTRDARAVSFVEPEVIADELLH